MVFHAQPCNVTFALWKYISRHGYIRWTTRRLSLHLIAQKVNFAIQQLHLIHMATCFAPVSFCSLFPMCLFQAMQLVWEPNPTLFINSAISETDFYLI